MSIVNTVKGWFTADGPRPRDRYASGSVTVLTGLLIAAIGLALFAAILELWPAVDRGRTSAATEIGVTLGFGLYSIKLTLSTGLILLAVVAGALGAYVHTATSFVTFVGNRTLKASWLWWYVLRTFIGAALALLLYFAFRGGVVTGQNASAEVNPYGIAAISGLAGLFSKQATDKLKEVFDTFFRTNPGEGDGQRADKPEERRPEISSLDPAEVKLGETPTVKVAGRRFERGAVVEVGARKGTTSYVSERELTVELDHADTDAARTLSVKVKNPAPNALTSEPKNLKVTPSYFPRIKSPVFAARSVRAKPQNYLEMSGFQGSR